MNIAPNVAACHYAAPVLQQYDIAACHYAAPVLQQYDIAAALKSPQYRTFTMGTAKHCLGSKQARLRLEGSDCSISIVSSKNIARTFSTVKLWCALHDLQTLGLA